MVNFSFAFNTKKSGIFIFTVLPIIGFYTAEAQKQAKIKANILCKHRKIQKSKQAAFYPLRWRRHFGVHTLQLQGSNTPERARCMGLSFMLSAGHFGQPLKPF